MLVYPDNILAYYLKFKKGGTKNEYSNIFHNAADV